MNEKDKKLIPTDPKEINAAYFAINAYTFPTQENYETLYANGFVSEDPKDMPPELEALFNSDAIKLNNPNLREQISRIMNQYDAESGPWYVDGDDSVLHIHNGSPGPDSGFVFKYQEEYGEVLKVRIGRKEIYGASAAKAMELPDYNREQIKAVVEPIMDLWVDPSIVTLPTKDAQGMPVDNIPGYQGYSGGWNAFEGRYGAGHLTPVGFSHVGQGKLTEETKIKMIESMRRTQLEGLNWNERYANSREYIKQDALKRTQVLSENDPLRVKQYSEALEEMAKRHEGEVSWAMHEMWDAYRTQGGEKALQPGEEEFLTTGRNITLIDTPGIEFTTHFKPTVQHYATEFNQVLMNPKRREAIGGITLNLNLEDKKVTEAIVASELSKATGKKYEVFSPEVTSLTQNIRREQQSWSKQGYNMWAIEFNPDGNRGFKVTPHLRKTQEKMSITALDAMAGLVRASKQPDLHSSFSAAMASLNNTRNKLRRAKHKELEVELLLIGRPALKAGMTLTLLGIGQKYSGKWYIKTCIHQMDNTGYTCSLTLIKNQLTANVSGKIGSSSNRKDSSGKIKATINNPMSLGNISRADMVLIRRNLNRLGKANVPGKMYNYDAENQTVSANGDYTGHLNNLEINELVEGTVGVYDQAKKGGHTAVFGENGIQIDQAQYLKNQEIAKEALRRKQQLAKEAADAKTKLKEIHKHSKSK